MHWRAQWRSQCHAKRPRGGGRIQHQEVIEPEPLDSLQLTLTIQPWASVSLQKRNGIWLDVTVFRNRQTLWKTWNLGQIFEIELWMVGQLHSRWLFTKKNCSKNLQIENRSSSCQRMSPHGFQTSNFICDRFDCKLWLRSIQNHARHRSQAFACSHLKSCWSIRIWADALFYDLIFSLYQN